MLCFWDVFCFAGSDERSGMPNVIPSYVWNSNSWVSLTGRVASIVVVVAYSIGLLCRQKFD